MALTFSIPDEILSTTLANYRRTMEDNVFKAIPLFYKLYQDGNKKVLSGGESIVVPLMYGTNETVGAYSGYEIIDVTPQEGISAAKYNWKQIAATIAISGREERQNSGQERIINLLDAKTRQTEQSLREYIGQKMFESGSDAGKDIHGLSSLVAASGTVGGISKSSYSWWQSQTGTAASFASNGLDEMRNIFNDCSAQAGNDQPNLIVTTQTEYERYEKLLQPQERFNDSKIADGGFQNILFKAVPIVWDPFCTSGKMYFLNTKYLNWNVHRDADFNTTDFVKPENLTKVLVLFKSLLINLRKSFNFVILGLQEVKKCITKTMDNAVQAWKKISFATSLA